MSKLWDWITGGIGAIIAAVAIIAVTAVANVFTGGALTPVLMGEIFGAIGGAAGAAATGGDIGRGMLIGTVVGGITGGILGPSGSASGGFIQAGVGETATWSISTVGNSVGNIAAQSIISSGVGAGSAVINAMTSTVYAAETNSPKSANGSNSEKASSNLGIDHQNIKTGWWPTRFNKFVLEYGNYGGPARNGPGSPIDLLDAAYERHDAGYKTGDLNGADERLLSDLRQLPINPREWGGQNGSFIHAIYGAIHRGGSYTTFSIRLNGVKARSR